jgi:hypothetical protein
VAVGNRSAIESFEACFKRTGFIADKVKLGRGGGQGFLHGSSSYRQKERLAVGSRFTWKGIEVSVTSFAEDSSYLTAFSYRGESCGNSKTDKRFKITREDIIADRKERKKRAAIRSRFDAAGKEVCERAQEAYRAAGIMNNASLDAMPFEKFCAIAEKFLPPVEKKKRTKKSGGEINETKE